MQVNVIPELEEEISLRVKKSENFYGILDMILVSTDDKYPNENEEYHMEKIQEFCLAISEIFMPDNNTGGFYETGKSPAKEMVDFYWFLNMTLTSMKTNERVPYQTV